MEILKLILTTRDLGPRIDWPRVGISLNVDEDARRLVSHTEFLYFSRLRIDGGRQYRALASLGAFGIGVVGIGVVGHVHDSGRGPGSRLHLAP